MYLSCVCKGLDPHAQEPASGSVLREDSRRRWEEAAMPLVLQYSAAVFHS
jgi:hypothetical protein